MNTVEQNLEKYAALAVHIGVNVQKGQTLVINAPITAVELVRKIARKAYEAGAGNVHVEWSDDGLALTKFMLAPDEAFNEYPMWKAKGMLEMAESGAGFLTVYAPNPDLLKDVRPERIAAANRTYGTAMRPYRSLLMANKACWSIIAFPSEEWALKVFPDASSPGEAVERLWEVIFASTRIDTEDPVQLWKDHIAKLKKSSAYLNNKQYKQLVYEAEGTHISVELPEGHIWHGGAAESEQGVIFSPNLPTEEIFTMPHREGVNGIVRSTKPLNYSGNVIDRFSLTFEKGAVVDFTAETGYETLKNLLETDDGARRLGEIALVPHHSPISMTQLIFFNTLFDENASSHFALGKAYPINIADGAGLSDEQLSEKGANMSLIHVDFMIGSASMNIDGVTEDGVREAIFRQGDWAI